MRDVYEPEDFRKTLFAVNEVALRSNYTVIRQVETTDVEGLDFYNGPSILRRLIFGRDADTLKLMILVMEKNGIFYFEDWKTNNNKNPFEVRPS
jgi:hypothetical protein